MKLSGTDCALCEGSGWKLHPETGGAMPCDCFEEYRIGIEMKAMGVPHRWINKTLAGYIPETDSEITSVAAIKYWVDSFPFPEHYEGARGLILSGNKGNGKTHLLCAIGKALIGKGVTPTFRRAADMLTNEQSDFGAEQEILSNASVLLIDDLGAEHAKDWGIRFLNVVLDARYSDDLVTLVTTNYTKQEIARTYGERFEDRLFEMCQNLRFDGRSRRQA